MANRNDPECGNGMAELEEMLTERGLYDVLEYALPELRMLFEVSAIAGIHVAKLFERVLNEGVTKFALGVMPEVIDGVIRIAHMRWRCFSYDMVTHNP